MTLIECFNLLNGLIDLLDALQYHIQAARIRMLLNGESGYQCETIIVVSRYEIECMFPFSRFYMNPIF